jgi:8-oxo-dGTP pyrophosphatase MutT (NUDIX family)
VKVFIITLFELYISASFQYFPYTTILDQLQAILVQKPVFWPLLSDLPYDSVTARLAPAVCASRKLKRPGYPLLDRTPEPCDSASGMDIEQAYGVIVIDRGEPSRLLLVRHRAGHWGFPKGHADAGESARETAARELAEETGLTDVTYLGTEPIIERYRLARKGRERDKTVTFFVAEAVNSTAVRHQPEELLEVRWATINEAAKLLTFESGKATLQTVCERTGLDA